MIFYVLACAVEDIERDLASSIGRPTVADLREHLDWLLGACAAIARTSRSAAPRWLSSRAGSNERRDGHHRVGDESIRR